MNCCDANGDCQQGDNCPVRAQMIEERNQRYVSWISDAGLGMLIMLSSSTMVIAGITVACLYFFSK